MEKLPPESSDNSEVAAVADLGAAEITPMDEFSKLARALTMVSKEELSEQEKKHAEKKKRRRS